MAMYEVLGNRDKQEAIRAANPEVQHCELLEISANACLGCKHNPLPEDAQDAKALVEADRPLIMRALDLADAHELGAVEAGRLSPADYLLLMLAKAYKDLQRDQGLAKLMAAELAKILMKVEGAP